MVVTALKIFTKGNLMTEELELTDTEQPTTSIVQIPNPQATVIVLQQEAERLLVFAEARVIKTDEDTKGATDDLSIISNAKRALESKRKEYIQPLNEQVKLINDTFKLVSEPLDKADKLNRNKVLAFRAEQEKKRQEQEEINRLRLEAAQKEMELKGELTESVNLVEVVPEPAKRVHSGMGIVGMRDSWHYEVIDFAAVPDEYKVIDHTMLNSIAKKHHDQKQIPGVRFYNEPILTVTTNKEG